jgi:ankyrin repeat protein
MLVSHFEAASEGHLDTLKEMLSMTSCAYAILDNEGVTPEDEAKTRMQTAVADFLSLLRWENRAHNRAKSRAKALLALQDAT